MELFASLCVFLPLRIIDIKPFLYILSETQMFYFLSIESLENCLVFYRKMGNIPYEDILNLVFKNFAFTMTKVNVTLHGNRIFI